ncbi:MAG: Uncharacterized protein G01um10147_100 [Microgenomates group bacterium Gr01-1014_7]|nr:MAG: Uncharacterized protein G01um10147_100 [Microgenomates group bacterium Gr01-1014_7]
MSLKEAILTLIFFTVITIVFFYKIFLGLIPLPTDLIVGGYYPWLSYKWGYITGVPVKNTKLSDSVSLFYPAKALAAEFEKKGEFPLWNPYMFGGYPLFASVSFGLLFPTMIFYLIFQAPIAWTLQTMSQSILASFFMYLLLRHLKLDKIASVFGSIAFGFGGFSILWLQWNTQATTALFLPILILLMDKYLISKKLRWGALFSIFLALQIFAGYLPIILLTLVSLVIWYIFRSNSLSSLKIIFFVILGILLSAVYLLPVGELIQISQRKVETLGPAGPFTPPENFINLIAPDFFGNDATSNFWGRGDHMDATLYVGIITLILALYGISKFYKKREVKFAVCLFIVTIIISVSNPLSDFLYKLGVWGGSSITMNRVNFMMNFSLSLLGAYGILAIKNFYSKLSLKPAILVAAVALGVILGLLISKEMLLKSLNEATVSSEIISWLARINISLRNTILPSFLIAVGVLLIYLSKKFQRIRQISAFIFILVLTFELFRFGLKFNTFAKPSFIYPQTPITNFLERYPNDRFIAEQNILPANMWVPFKLSSMQGYDGIYPLNTAKLLAVADSDNTDATPMTRWGVLQNFNSKILDETNTRFLLIEKKKNQYEASDKYKKVFEDKEVVVLENTQALPRVYLTKKVIKTSDQQTLKLLLDENFPIRTTSVTEDFEFNNVSEETLSADLEYRSVTNSHVVIKANSNIDAYLVVLDSFYPGWKAKIDGNETKIHRTNYNFRGILLPKGDHIVEFIYTPESLKYGAMMSGTSLLIILLLLLYPSFKRIYGSR